MVWNFSFVECDTGPREPLHPWHGRIRVNVGLVIFSLFQNGENASRRVMAGFAGRHFRCRYFLSTIIDGKRLAASLYNDLKCRWIFGTQAQTG